MDDQLLNDSAVERKNGESILVGVTSRHRNVEFSTAFGRVSGVTHTREELYPQCTGILRRWFPKVAKCAGSLGLARIRNGSELLHSRQKILLNQVPWVVSYDALMPFWPRPHISKSLYRRVAGILASEQCRAVLPYSKSAMRLLEIRNADHGRLDDILNRCQIVMPGVKDYPAAYGANVSRDNSKEVHILFVGTQFFIKSGHLLVNAYSRLQREYPVRLTVVSSMSIADWTTERDPALANLYRGIFIELGIKHFEYLDNDEVRELMGTADIFVMPSIDETFGVVFLEALASGVPVIGSSIRAMPEIIKDGLTGFCVPHECTEEGLMVRSRGFEKDLEREIERTLRSVLDDLGLLRRMKIAARKDYLARFTMERLARDLGNVYFNALS